MGRRPAPTEHSPDDLGVEGAAAGRHTLDRRMNASTSPTRSFSR